MGEAAQETGNREVLGGGVGGLYCPGAEGLCGHGSLQGNRKIDEAGWEPGRLSEQAWKLLLPLPIPLQSPAPLLHLPHQSLGGRRRRAGGPLAPFAFPLSGGQAAGGVGCWAAIRGISRRMPMRRCVFRSASVHPAGLGLELWLGGELGFGPGRQGVSGLDLGQLAGLRHGRQPGEQEAEAERAATHRLSRTYVEPPKPEGAPARGPLAFLLPEKDLLVESKGLITGTYTLLPCTNALGWTILSFLGITRTILGHEGP